MSSHPPGLTPEQIKAHAKGIDQSRRALLEPLDQDERLAVSDSLEQGIQAGKVRPFVALEIARKLDLPLPAWIQRQADHFAGLIAAKPERCHTGDHLIAECPGDHGK